MASQLPYIDKVLFVVDRKDLDYQTMKEYDRFEKGAANSNTSTTILKRQLESPEAHIIITTIQKLATFIKKNPGHEVYQKHVVIIFDECHRSQFGDMHGAIVHNFKKVLPVRFYRNTDLRSKCRYERKTRYEDNASVVLAVNQMKKGEKGSTAAYLHHR